MTTAVDIEADQYLTFRLDSESFALTISKVREILDYTAITRLPRMPAFMRGVINLRGKVVPIVDLRERFGMSATERTANTCIIITEIATDDQVAVIGALADAVQEVVDLEPSQIEPAPRIGTHLHTRFITGMGKRDGSFLIILDFDRIFSTEELERVQEAGADPNQPGA